MGWQKRNLRATEGCGCMLGLNAAAEGCNRDPSSRSRARVASLHASTPPRLQALKPSHLTPSPLAAAVLLQCICNQRQDGQQPCPCVSVLAIGAAGLPDFIAQLVRQLGRARQQLQHARRRQARQLAAARPRQLQIQPRRCAGGGRRRCGDVLTQARTGVWRARQSHCGRHDSAG